MRILLAGALFALQASAATTFSRDVWPIVEQKCVSCHQPGEIAPMPFTSYKQVRPWAGAIREAILSRAMPPWHAVQVSAHTFRNDRSLKRTEIQTIVDWIDAGCPEGPPLPLYTIAVKEQNWKLGKPDLMVQVPGFAIPKTGPLPYSLLIVPLHLDRDTWVRAAEFRIDQRGLVHHMNAFIRPPGSSYLAGFPDNQIFTPTVAERGKRREGEGFFARRQLLLGYEPGYESMPWLDGGAKLIQAGSDLVLEIHFNPNGKEAIDYSQIGLYFATTPPENRVLAIDSLRDLDLLIPPKAPDYLSKASMTLARPAKLLSIQPHMHVRGRSMEVRAIYPHGQTETLLSVPKYDFNWQTTYVFEKPVDLPAGTLLESIAGYDNSPNNAFNPDPGVTVRWGDQTTDEMHIAFLELIIGGGADPEKLLTAIPKMIGSPPVAKLAK